ncbi:MAG: glycyl-radical enzyme activating protein [Clostridia bacterium]|nr:glycyl-radical enzyme activating protein [Clostridia bacterium]
MIFNIQRYCIDDGDGIRTCVFFKGCPLRCKWCHNIESVAFAPQEEFDEKLCIRCGKCKEGCPTGARQIVGKEMTPKEIMEIVRRDRSFYGKNGGLTVSGGEPMAQFNSVYALAQLAKAEGISFMMETCGYAKTEDFVKIAPLCDCFLYDCKASAARHKELTGVDDVLILKNLDVLYRLGSRIVLRCPIVPGGNLDDEFIEKIASLRRKYPKMQVQLMPYHRTGIEKAKRLGLPSQEEYTPPDKDLLAQIWKRIERQNA